MSHISYDVHSHLSAGVIGQGWGGRSEVGGPRPAWALQSDEAGMDAGLLALSTWPKYPDVKQPLILVTGTHTCSGGWRGQRKQRE